MEYRKDLDGIWNIGKVQMKHRKGLGNRNKRRKGNRNTYGMDMEYMGGPLGWNIGWKKGKVQMKYRKGLDEIQEGLDEIKERFRWNIGKVQMEYRKDLDGKK